MGINGKFWQLVITHRKNMPKQLKRLTIIISILLLTSVIFLLLRFAPVNINELQSYASNATSYLEAKPLVGMCLFIAVYFLANAAPVPFVSLLTILAGYLFGTLTALIIVSFANALGASFLFLISRYFLRDWIQKNLLNKSKWLTAGLNNSSFWYATSLRLLPGMPFSVPSIALSFTQISLLKFYLSTQLGLIFILFIFVNAGSQLTQLNSIDDIFNLKIIISMLMLAVVPLLLSFITKRFFKNTKEQ